MAASLPSPLRESKDRPFATRIQGGQWLSHPDDRLWGRRYTFQNQRLLYWPLLMSGDFDLLQPFFMYYARLLPVRKAITQAWFGHEGAYYRENIEPTGAERDCGRDGKPPKTAPGENRGEGYYHSYYFTCGLETLAMMIEYVKYSADHSFRDTVCCCLLPGKSCSSLTSIMHAMIKGGCASTPPWSSKPGGSR